MTRKTKRPGGGFSVHATAWGAKHSKNVSVTQSQPEPQTGRIQGTVVSMIRNPGSHGPDVPETREANVKCTDKLIANWMWISSYPKATCTENKLFL
ncbi:hypothetical protein Prudu_004232 [Prunus dulcis]|uniref:Uncharacterized protein n=1 Tax=Prunus dulcis TaxID=3755 RepID=A0A4Y1QUU0_PRUDU|nr:hypothetical protein Prudu_004232 [Prunus dulcis]